MAATRKKQLECDVLFEHQDLLALTLAHPQPHKQPQSRTLKDGTQLTLIDTGILAIEPPQPGDSDIVLSCGVHGNETAPIELVNELVNAILSGDLVCRQRLLVQLGNPEAMLKGTRGVQENMNRLFSGAHALGEQNSEKVRARLLEQTVRDFYHQSGRKRFHYDLHTAIRDSQREKFAVYPYRPGRAWSIEQIRFLAGCGVETILLSHNPTTTYSYYSSNEFGADAFTVELGKVYPFGQNDMSRFEACKKQLARLIAAQPLEYPPLSQSVVFDVCQVVNKQHEAFHFSFDDAQANFTEYPPGALLAQDGETDVRVGEVAESIVFPNAKVALGQRALLTVVPTAIDDRFE
ncbi:succinylglutamate desuccinylase [Ferrimonas kyonanensis]|uniref:succinylglutamate desuccinylase n=1 Tax=Ferrimonas kyonanensis TaxID=364763 RepID=UPI00040396BA|nr:succinylglutamate desuccinylase [Ferrimonas kyonanensis]